MPIAPWGAALTAHAPQSPGAAAHPQQDTRPRALGHPGWLSQRHRQISSSIFQAAPLAFIQFAGIPGNLAGQAGLYINPSGHFVKQSVMSKWPQYLECSFVQVTGQQSS